MPRTTANSKMIMAANPDSPISEVYRTLKLNIEFSVFDRELKTITITSANDGEGKTTTALNLAAAYAKAGRKVVLVDANLRRPAVHLAFNETNNTGLSNYLAGMSTVNDIIKQSKVPNLTFIASGPIPPNPSELLASERMKSLLAELNEQYDVVIIDTPPALSLTDARIIATKCDGVLLVVNQGKLKRTEAKKLNDDLVHLKVNLIGVVFNKMNTKDAAAYLYRS
ncbi:CpsD/CapB family tyrosine-protein kinase [Paenibacillus cremeus]|uniref:non-specific protein-tyrosine kinase n=1 Tax=Paenibacillus cremeus TaxID=2163881 RepID=A0A559K0J6_9BACL|nr:CpsD/CapB family tyrosine-protein kinase [Paenibacillus cremeus]TVY05616.1 CpsD/CapB family tyrosine-protein kinase [Paenibacillus cremeus]